MTELVVETPEGLTLRRELASGGSRSAAALIDTGICLLAVLSAVFLTEVVLGGAGGLGAVILAGTLLFLIAYHVAFGRLWNGQTPGKRVLGLSVVDERGLPANFVQHFLRGVFWPLEALALVPVPIGIVLMAATPGHQRLGDLVAGTMVVRDTDRRLSGEILVRSRWSALPSRRLDLVPAHAARFDGEDYRFLREVVGRAKVDPEARARLLRRALRHYAARLDLEITPEPTAKEARSLLAELYLFLREMRAGSTEPGSSPNSTANRVRGT